MQSDYVNKLEFKQLKQRLRLAEWQVIGVLESLMRLAADRTPRGDIGYLADDEIAAGIDWQDDPDRLIKALVETGWIVFHPEHRLVIADWEAMSPERVRKRLRRSSQSFIGGPGGPGSGETRRKGPADSGPSFRLSGEDGDNEPPRPAASHATSPTAVNREVARSRADAGGNPSFIDRQKCSSGHVQTLSGHVQPRHLLSASAPSAPNERNKSEAPRGAQRLSGKENDAVDDARITALREEVERTVGRGRSVQQLLADSYFEWAEEYQRRFPGSRVKRLLEHPTATAERIAYLILRAHQDRVANPVGFVIAGVQQGWAVPFDFARAWRSIKPPQDEVTRASQAINMMKMNQGCGGSRVQSFASVMAKLERRLSAAGG